jgi:hypothetical protein
MEAWRVSYAAYRGVMKVKLTLLRRDTTTAIQHTTVLVGRITDPDLVTLRQFWETERAINEHTSIRCHLELTEEELTDADTIPS